VAEVKEVTVPDIGDFEDVPVIEILVSAGDEIEEEAPLVTLESDKATMDVPAPFAGTVEELLVDVGDTVSEGSPILKVATGGNGAAPDAAQDEDEEAVDEEAGDEERGQAESASEAGSGAAPGASGDGAGADEAAETSAAPAGNGEVPAYASPAVRRLAREKAVDLSGVQGSGRKGRITTQDVEQAAQGGGGRDGAGDGGKQAADVGDSAAEEGLGLAPWPSLNFDKQGETERVELTRIQKISGPNLARNWVRIPHVTHQDEADVTDLEAFRKQLNAEQSDVKVTMVAILVRACVASLKAFPRFNASLDGDELILKNFWNIGFAADTPQGLVVPVIKGADQKGLLDIAGELTALSGAAREGKLKMSDMQGATFTISSLGGIGGTGFTPIINAPEVAILGATRSAMRPVWDGEQFQPRLMLPLSLSYDHRVIDGAAAARFSAHLVGVLEDMRRILL
jgi:pyruvate dehydrogenase E2 component (dihydrolipoyllysine-residue acetyltransferase)